MDCNIIHSVYKSKINVVLVFVSVFSINIDFYHFSRLDQFINFILTFRCKNY